MMLSYLKATSSGVLVSFLTSLSLIFGSEASEQSARNYPPFFYRCNNGQTVVRRAEYQSTKGTTVSIYPFPVEEQSQVLRRRPARFTEGRHSVRYFISDHGQEFDCNPWSRSDGDVFGIPDPAALRRYAKRFNPVARNRFICAGGHSVVLRITDFVDAGHRHGLMEVGDEEQIGLYFTRGTSGHFNSKSTSTPGLSFAWAVHSDDAQRSVMRWFLSIDDKSFNCKPLP